MAKLTTGQQLQIHEENVRLTCINLVGDKLGVAWLRNEEEQEGIAPAERLRLRAEDIVAAAKVLEDYVRFPHVR